MKVIIICSILFFSANCFAQPYINYTFDPSGNRVVRQYVVPRLANPADSTVVNKFGINVFPNPVSAEVNIRILGLEEGKSATIQLLNIEGKILNLRHQTSKQELYDLSDLVEGIYFIRVWIDSESVLYKIEKL